MALEHKTTWSYTVSLLFLHLVSISREIRGKKKVSLHWGSPPVQLAGQHQDRQAGQTLSASPEGGSGWLGVRNKAQAVGWWVMLGSGASMASHVDSLQETKQDTSGLWGMLLRTAEPTASFFIFIFFFISSPGPIHRAAHVTGCSPGQFWWIFSSKALRQTWRLA